MTTAKKTPHLTTKDLMAAFNVSHMTVLAWRKGSASRPALPVIAAALPSVQFSPAKVEAWAKRHGLVYKGDLAAIASASDSVKPGPKAVAKPAVKKSALRVKQVSKPAAKPARKGFADMAAHTDRKRVARATKANIDTRRAAPVAG